MQETPRSMTGKEKIKLVLFVARREWVLLAMGALMIGASLCFVSGVRVSESVVGTVLAGLLVVAMGLFLWMRLAQDIRDGRVAEADVTAVEKQSTRNEAAVVYELVSANGQRFEVSALDYVEIQPPGRYRLIYTVAQHIALVVHEITDGKALSNGE